MGKACPIDRVRVYALSIPLRKPFEHAAQVRAAADPVVLEIELADGTVGYGETLPRPYVTGETVGGVVASIEDTFIEELLTFRPGTFPEALERIDALPSVDEQGETILAARAAVELALLDAYSRHFKRPVEEAVSWLGLPGLGRPGSLEKVRYSGVLSGRTERLAFRARLMRWYGLRDFKLKVGYDDDEQRVRETVRGLKRVLGRTATLRLDANGAWTGGQAIERLSAWDDVPISTVEQPLARGQEEELPRLKRMVPVKIMHDESLVSMSDAERLLEMGVADAFNIRLAKNGGFLACLRLAHFARKHGILYQLGCMVGETSILSAAGRHFLDNVPGVSFAEGSYGPFLLKGDVVERPVRFSYGGKPRPLDGFGWGIEVKRELLERHTAGEVLEFPL